MNFLRLEALRDQLRVQPEIRLVLPDLAMFEMAKSSNRELTLKLSLDIIAQEPHRVFVSRALSDCLSYELSRKVAVVGHLLDRESTIFLRRLLSAVATGIRNAEYDQVIDDPQNYLSDMKRDYLDDSLNKTRSVQLVDVTKRVMTPEFANRLRGSLVGTPEKIHFVHEKAQSLLLEVLKENGFSHEKVIYLRRQKPMILRYFYVKLWACLSWEEQGRIENINAGKVTNDLIDHEYVLAATFFNGVLSNDRAVNDTYAAVSQLLTW